MRLASALFALVALFPAAAFGDAFISTRYGFSADYPTTPSVGDPQASESDANGTTTANTVMIQDAAPGVYTAMVTVETYTVPMKIDAPTTLLAMAKGFVAQLDANMTSNKGGKFDGRPARFFTYDTPDHSVAGRGMIVLVPAKRPRIYLVIANRTPRTSADDIAALDKFYNSFQLE